MGSIILEWESEACWPLGRSSGKYKSSGTDAAHRIWELGGSWEAEGSREVWMGWGVEEMGLAEDDVRLSRYG